VLNALAKKFVIPKAKRKLQGSRSLDLVRITRCQAAAALSFKSDPLSSRKVKAIKVHHLVPGRHKVTHERVLGVAARIDFR
jgi:hypothetical protein